MFAMAGGTYAHSRIIANLLRSLGNRLEGTNCVPNTSELRVKTETTGLYTYPDVLVVCGRAQLLDERRDTLLNPILIVEVLSDSTEAYDRGKKFEHYRQLPSCREYLLVSQKEPRIEQFIRQANGEWTLKEAGDIRAEIHLPSLQVVLPLSEVFSKVQFTPGRLRTRI